VAASQSRVRNGCENFFVFLYDAIFDANEMQGPYIFRALPSVDLLLAVIFFFTSTPLFLESSPEPRLGAPYHQLGLECRRTNDYLSSELINASTLVVAPQNHSSV
jgi:hypothetical protein